MHGLCAYVRCGFGWDALNAMMALARVFPHSRLLEDGGNDKKKGALARRALLVKGALSFSRNSKQKLTQKQKPAVVLTLSSDSRRLLWQFVLWLLTDGEFQACLTDPIGYIRSVGLDSHDAKLRFG